MRVALPIDDHLEKIVACFASSSNVIIHASPGSGKTTRVPKALLDTDLTRSGKEIWVLVPRRLAAKAAAFRVAMEWEQEVGHDIGYQFRFERCGGKHTRLWYMTEGLLLRHLLSDPQLTRAGCILLDEFHERHLQTDVALALLTRLQKTTRPDLKLGILSATLDAEPLIKYFGTCPLITVETPVYPLEVRYKPLPGLDLDCQLSRVLEQHLKDMGRTGDILVFLPGLREIRRCEEKLKALRGQVDILCLHGDFSQKEQEAIFHRATRRRVILTTNIAESSLTIEGVDTVIDSGLYRRASYSWWSGVPALRTRPISQASARQRAGRAARTGPGLAIRLYTEHDLKGRPAFELPEIQRADLTQMALELASSGHPLSQLNWFEPPPAGALEAADSLLELLGAIDAAGKPTRQGHKMAKLALHPRLSRLLLEGEKRGVNAVVRVAALASEGEIPSGDILDHLNKPVSPNTARLEKMLQKEVTFSTHHRAAEHETLPHCLLGAFPDRVAKRASERSDEKGFVKLALCQGGEAFVQEKDLKGHEFACILDVLETRHAGQKNSRFHVRSLCPIETEWLWEAPLLQEKTGLSWDAPRGRVVEHVLLQYGDLVLEESLKKSAPSPAAAALLLKEGVGLVENNSDHQKWPTILEKLRPFGNSEALENILARLQLAGRHFPQAGFPDFTQDVLDALKTLLASCVSLTDLKELNWIEAPLESLDARQKALLAKLTPVEITLKRGRKTRVHYRLDQTPWIESYLQDFIGMEDGPCICEGRLALNLHLLAPNKRPVQITTDLKSFWKNIYPEIRNQLARKYPRREWP